MSFCVPLTRLWPHITAKATPNLSIFYKRASSTPSVKKPLIISSSMNQGLFCQVSCRPPICPSSHIANRRRINDRNPGQAENYENPWGVKKSLNLFMVHRQAACSFYLVDSIRLLPDPSKTVFVSRLPKNWNGLLGVG